MAVSWGSPRGWGHWRVTAGQLALCMVRRGPAADAADPCFSGSPTPAPSARGIQILWVSLGSCPGQMGVGRGREQGGGQPLRPHRGRAFWDPLLRPARPRHALPTRCFVGLWEPRPATHPAPQGSQGRYSGFLRVGPGLVPVDKGTWPWRLQYIRLEMAAAAVVVLTGGDDALAGSWWPTSTGRGDEGAGVSRGQPYRCLLDARSAGPPAVLAAPRRVLCGGLGGEACLVCWVRAEPGHHK